MAALPGRRVGLALPTAVAAVVCGGSVLGVAVSGAFALDSREHAAVEALAPAGADPDRAGARSPLDAAARVGARSRPTRAPVGPADASPPATVPTATASVPPVASTAGEYSATVPVPRALVPAVVPLPVVTVTPVLAGEAAPSPSPTPPPASSATPSTATAPPAGMVAVTVTEALEVR